MMRTYTAVLALGFAAALLDAHPRDNAAGKFVLDWREAQIEKTLAVGIFNAFGLRVDNDPSRAMVKDGVVQGIAIAFDVDDGFAFDIDEDVFAEIELNVTHLKTLYYAYDRNGGPDALRKYEIPESLIGWQTLTLTLDRARFANRGYGNTDFAIASGFDMSSQLLFVRSLRFRRAHATRTMAPNATLELSLTDAEHGNAVAAQVGLFDATGRMPLPSELAVEIQVFDERTRHVEVRDELGHLSWPHTNHYSMYVDGFYKAEVPPGRYDLVIVKGPEYPIVQRSIDISLGRTNRIDVTLEHAIDLPARGWYSGDVHNHFSRRNTAQNPNHMVHARAHDLHMHWLYALGNSTTTHFPQYAFGDEGLYRERDYYLGSGQEDPRTDFLGHVLSMGHDEMVRSPDQYLIYEDVAREVRRRGGIFGVAHMDFAQFQQDIALALLAPKGLIDFVEVLQYGVLHLDDWYAFLNMGFQLPAAAGSDWPYMSLPGAVRTYVYIGDEFTPDAWNRSLRDGRSFVTNGPVLELDVNGRSMGSVLDVAAGTKIHIAATATIEPTWDLLTDLELIVNGEVVHRIGAEGGRLMLELDYELEATHGMWLAVKTWGNKSRDIVFQTPYTMRVQAHSSPVYVHVDDEPSWDRVAGPERIEALIERLEAFPYEPSKRNDNEAWESPERTAELLRLLHQDLVTKSNEAIAFYRERLDAIRRAGE